MIIYLTNDCFSKELSSDGDLTGTNYTNPHDCEIARAFQKLGFKSHETSIGGVGHAMIKDQYYKFPYSGSVSLKLRKRIAAGEQINHELVAE